MKSLNISI